MTVSLPTELLQKIDSAAERERRNRSQWLVLTLERLLKPIDAGSAPDASAGQFTPEI